MFQYILYGCIFVVAVVATALCFSAAFGKNRKFHTVKIVIGACLYFFVVIFLVASFLT